MVRLDDAVASGPLFDILVTVTILRNGAECADGSGSDSADAEDLDGAVITLGAALGRSVALEALEQERSGQQRFGG